MENLSTSKWKEFTDYTVNKIETCRVDWDPYWHVVIEDTLHPELFALVENEWPDYDVVEHRTNVEGFNQNRRYTMAEREDLPFWYGYYNNIINHPAIVDAVYKLEDIERPDSHYCTSSLWEDYRGYGVNNHYDAHTINVAMQTYVYCDGGERWGTSLNDEDGNELKRFPFKPNLSWIMRVDASSWHSCDPIECDLRRSIMARYMTKERN